ncbi:hypothetical protein TNCV_3139721 [Trichonephila clavipes]|nr:hypothetical protein TNCV_3139721 [Trichonephila clavipes]
MKEGRDCCLYTFINKNNSAEVQDWCYSEQVHNGVRVASPLSIVRAQVCHRIHDILVYQKVRVERKSTEKHEFLFRILTSHETWVHHITPKNQSLLNDLEKSKLTRSVISRQRSAFDQVSEFDSGRIVVYRDCGLAFREIGSRVGQN